MDGGLRALLERPGVRIDDNREEDRSTIRGEDNLSNTDRRSRLGRRASASRSPDVPTNGPVINQRGSRARFDEGLVSSSRGASQHDGWTRSSVREGTGDPETIRYVIRMEADRDDRGETLPIP